MDRVREAPFLTDTEKGSILGANATRFFLSQPPRWLT
jgi:hypothetical protein